MAAPDPLASPTLAQLYLGQGRLDRAREVLEALLRDDPYAGAALALHRRLATRERGTLTVRGGAQGLVVRYELAEIPRDSVDAAVHVVLTIYELTPSGNTVQRVTSKSAGTASGELVFDAPAGPASATACLARLVAGRVSILAVAPAHSY